MKFYTALTEIFLDILVENLYNGQSRFLAQNQQRN
jgi:hypothetical protein